MQEKEERAEKGKKGLHLVLSRTAVFFWSLGLLILLGWIFTLGILAGRGLLPSGAKTLGELKNQIVKLQEMVGRKDASELDRIKEMQKEPEFGFYDELSSKKMTEVISEREPQLKQPGTERMEKLETTALVSERNVEKPETTTPASERYVVQVASLDQEKKALEMVNRLVKRGYPAYHYKTFIKGRSYYRVRCGMFNTRTQALKLQQKLENTEHLKGYVQKVEGP